VGAAEVDVALRDGGHAQLVERPREECGEGAGEHHVAVPRRTPHGHADLEQSGTHGKWIAFIHSYTDKPCSTNTSGAVRVRVVYCSGTPRHLARWSPGIEPATFVLPHNHSYLLSYCRPWNTIKESLLKLVTYMCMFACLCPGIRKGALACYRMWLHGEGWRLSTAKVCENGCITAVMM